MYLGRINLLRKINLLKKISIQRIILAGLVVCGVCRASTSSYSNEGQPGTDSVVSVSSSRVCNKGFIDRLKYNIGSFFLVATVHSFTCCFFPWKSKEYEYYPFWVNGFLFSFLCNYLVGGLFCFIHCCTYTKGRYYIISQLILNVLSILIVDLLSYCFFMEEERRKREEDRKEWEDSSFWNRIVFSFKVAFS